MGVTKVGVVYSKNQKVRRRVIVLDHEGADDSNFELHKRELHPGEGWLEVPLEVYQMFLTPDGWPHKKFDSWIESQIGPRKPDRCAVVCRVEGVVRHVVCADPAIDFHPDGNIIPHESAVVGDKL